MAGTVRVEGLEDLIRAFHGIGGTIQAELDAELEKIGVEVRNQASWLFDKYDERSAAGLKVKTRIRGVSVEQTIGKTTGRRGDFGALQMTRALLPALRDHEHDIERRAISVVERVNNMHF